jgi:hypothetical protein
MDGGDSPAHLSGLGLGEGDEEDSRLVRTTRDRATSVGPIPGDYWVGSRRDNGG